MRFTVLGSGGMGTPPIGIVAPGTGPTRRGSIALVLQPNYPKPPTLLIDAGPDLWSQWMAWQEAPPRPDAVILTHSHYDHVAGLGNLMYCTPPVEVYAREDALEDLRGFAEIVAPGYGLFRTKPRQLPERGSISVCGVHFETLVLHHSVPVAGMLVRHRGRSFAHLSDTGPAVDASVRTAIQGCDLLVVNTPTVLNTDDHLGALGAIALARSANAGRLILTHIGHTVSDEALAGIEAEHPWIIVARDGLVADV